MADDAQQAVENAPAQVKIEDVGPARKKINIEISEDHIQAKIQENFGKLQSDVQIPGFRRGKAPKALLERRFGSTLRDDVKAQLISEAYSHAVEDNQLEVLGEPEIKDAEEIELPESGPLNLEVEVEVAPNIELPDFTNITVTKPTAEVTDQDVEEELGRLQERFGQSQQVEDTELAEGDFVLADAHVFAGENVEADAHGEGEEGPEVLAHHHGTYIMVPGESRNYKGHVAGIIIEDLGKQLIGKKPGQEVRISMTGPSGHENEKIKGQPITVAIQLQSVERTEPLPVAELVERVGLESEEDLRGKIRESIQERKDREQRSDMHKQVADQLVEQVTTELPEALTARQTERALQRRRMELLYRGTSEEEIEEQMAEMRSGTEEDAVKQLKLFFILSQAAKELEIDVAQNEINQQVMMVAMQQGRRPEKVRQQMTQSGELDAMYVQIREQKTLDNIIEKAKVEESSEPAKAE